MGYVLAVWNGEAPDDSVAAMVELDQRFEHYRSCDHLISPEIHSFIDDLLERWPVDSEEDFVNSPWQRVTLSNDARGDMIYLGLVSPVLPELLEEIAVIAHRHELVMVDPQQRLLY